MGYFLQLMELESRFANDDRFKLNKRFLEGVDVDESDEEGL